MFHIDTLLVNSFTNSIGIFVLKVLDGKAKPPSRDAWASRTALFLVLSDQPSGRFQFNVSRIYEVAITRRALYVSIVEASKNTEDFNYEVQFGI